MGQTQKTWMKWKHNFVVGFGQSWDYASLVLLIILIHSQVYLVQGVEDIIINPEEVVLRTFIDNRFIEDLPPLGSSDEILNCHESIGEGCEKMGDEKINKNMFKRSVSKSSESGKYKGSLGPLRIFKYITADTAYTTTESSRRNKDKSYNYSWSESNRSSLPTEQQSATLNDRSLIRNSFFRDSGVGIKNQTNEGTDQPKPSESKLVNKVIKLADKSRPTVNSTTEEIFINGTISERPRRSPYRHPAFNKHRSPLFHRGIGVGVMAQAPPPPPQHTAAGQFQGRSQGRRNPPQIQQAVVLPLPYTSMNNEFQSPSTDYYEFRSSGGRGPWDPSLQEPTFQNYMYQRPRRPPPHLSGRRLPIEGRRRGRPNPSNMQSHQSFPQPQGHPPQGHSKPTDRPTHRPRPMSRNKRPRPPKPRKPNYKYPKNAENIQDILQFFDKENEVDGSGGSMRLKPFESNFEKSPSIGNGVGGSDFSNELKDVQSSLLRDIREFAKRPSIMDPETNIVANDNDNPHDDGHHSHNNRDNINNNNDEVNLDDIFEPQPKPVRDMIKMNGKRMRDEDGSRENSYKDIMKRDRHQSTDRDNGNKNRYQIDDESIEGYREDRNQRPNRNYHSTERYSNRNRDRKSVSIEERERDRHRPYRTKVRVRSKSRDDFRSFEDLAQDRYRDRDRIRDYTNIHRMRPSDSDEYIKSKASEPYKPQTRPVVIKRPYETYRPVEIEPKKRPEHDHYWNTLNANSGNSRESFISAYKKGVSVPIVKASPMSYSYNHYNLYGGSNPMSTIHSNSKSYSSPEDEDILEIHTGAGQITPYQDLTMSDRDKQMQLQKLYMDFLQQKLQAEAAAAAVTANPIPPPKPKKSPMRMKIHIYPNEGGSADSSQTQHYAVAPNRNQNFVASVNPNHNYGGSGTGYSASNPSNTLSSPNNKQQIYSQNLQNFQHNMNSYNSNINPNPNRSMPPSPGPGLVPSSSHYGAVSIANGVPITATTAVDKNKNVVLHLHVHRRNDVQDQMELEAEASEVHTSTVKSLTYNEIYDDQQMQPAEEESEPNKSVSMEVPIHDDKIEDVLHTLLKMRENN